MKNKKLDLNALLAEIKSKKARVNRSGKWPELAAKLSEKYMKPLDPEWGTRLSSGDDPYTDILHAAMASMGVILD